MLGDATSYNSGAIEILVAATNSHLGFKTFIGIFTFDTFILSESQFYSRFLNLSLFFEFL